MLSLDLNTGATAPVTEEVTLNSLPVTGRIPADLNGTLFRNGPNPLTGKFAGEGMLTWWVGSAMLHGLVLGGGRALRYSNRWARTNQWARHTERPVDPDPTWEQNPNVHVLAHAGHRLALGEGGVPFVVNDDLTPDRPFTFGGALPGGMTAHPKVDPVTGDLVYFRSHWQAPFLTYGVIDKNGRSLVSQEIEVEAPCMVHDCAITATRTLLLDSNVAYDFSLLQREIALPLRWHEDRQSRIGVLGRGGGEITWVEIAPCFLQHVINAYDRDEHTIVLDAIRYPGFLRLASDGNGFEPNPLGTAYRFVLDLRTRTALESALEELPSELPRINERFTGLRHRFSYAVEQPSPVEMRGIVKLDVDSGATERHSIPAGDQNSEPIFVPRGEGEDNGWILSCVYRKGTHTTDVLVLNASNVAAEPFATIHLPVPIPAGFHGAWIPEGHC